MNYNLKSLEKFLKETPIPYIKKRPLTFLGISKQPHYENVWSNIYAFFFDTDAEHNLGDLFLQSLLQLINEDRNPKFKFNPSFEIKTEAGTNNNGRIDILLSNNNDAIIIENKVYHHLNNNLNDYWSSVPQLNKQGVVLSLHKTFINNINFIGITHLELLQRVTSNLSNYFLNANEKHLIFLKDFYQNIINITNPMDTSTIKFFYRNQELINEVADIKSNYISYVISEVEKARVNIDEKLESYSSRNENYRYYLCPNEGNLLITVVFDGLFRKSKELMLIVELQNELLKETEKIRSISFSETEMEYLRSDFYNQKGSWAHFATQTVKPNEDDILNLGDFISKTINNSAILDIYRKLKTKLVDEK